MKHFIFSLIFYANVVTGEDVTMKDHVFYEIFEKKSLSIRKKFDSSRIKNHSVKLIFGGTGTDIVDHYIEMVSFIAENIPGDGMVGSGAKAYYPVTTYVSNNDIKSLTKLTPIALDNFKQDPSWDKWLEGHEGDTSLALKSIILSSGWTRWPLLNSMDEMKDYIEATGYTGGMYSHLPLASSTFGLDLSGENGGAWGKGYKTVAGMNLAFAAKAEGYSDDDTIILVSRANLLYEASDFLYDHIGLNRRDISQEKDRTHEGLKKEYKNIMKSVRKLIDNDDLVLKKMIAAMIDMNSLYEEIPEISKKHFKDDLILVFLLLNYQYANPSGFENDFGHLFDPANKDQLRIKKLLENGVNDVKVAMDGANFVLEHLDENDLSKSDPCFEIKDFQGIFSFENRVRKVLRFF